MQLNMVELEMAEVKSWNHAGEDFLEMVSKSLLTFPVLREIKRFAMIGRYRR